MPLLRAEKLLQALSRKGILLGFIALVSGLGAAACRRSAPLLAAQPMSSPAAALLRWPGPAAPLLAPPLLAPADFGVRRVYIDAGHGARDNRGNSSSYCIDEQDFTLNAARELASRLEATGHFKARLSRDGSRPVEYRDRVADAATWEADAFVSLHSDVRSHVEQWSPKPGVSCRRSLASPGFAVLWSDEGPAPQSARRLELARALSRRMREAGFPPYDGAEYTGLYESDPAERGVFVDRHAPDKRIFVLRRTSMPAILVETHHALDPREADRWTEPRTFDAFAAALAAALVDALTPGPDEGRPAPPAR